MASADQAAVEDIGELPADDLLAGQRLWAVVDSPWVTSVDRASFQASLQPLRELDPSVVLYTHLPPAHAATAQLLDTLETAPEVDPSLGPDQVVVEKLLAELEPRPPSRRTA
jgi:hypothetical protein